MTIHGSRWVFVRSLLLALFFGTASLLDSAAAVPACTLLKSRLGEPVVKVPSSLRLALRSQPDLAKFVDDFFRINPASITEARTLVWEELDRLSKSIEMLREMRAKGDIDAAKTLAKLAEGAEVSATLAKFRDAWNAARLDHEYAASEYELKSYFVERLKVLNGELPEAWRIAVPELPPNPKYEALVLEGRALLARQEDLMEKLLPTTGFESIEGLRTAIKADPGSAGVLAELDAGTMRIAMSRPSRGRFWIQHAGFQNQRVTGTSGGMNSPAKRDAAESNLLNMAVAEYQTKDDELKPQYGHVRRSPETGDPALEGGASSYGDDVYFFKAESITDRTTFFMTDSLGPGYRARAEKWDQIFIPWKYRDLMAPFIELSLDSTGATKAQQRSSSAIPELTTESAYYIETQIFGPLRLTDVDAFQFNKTPPAGEFLAALTKQGVKIYDGRQGKPRPWVP